MQISITVSCKSILWFLMGMVKHSQSSKSSKFAVSLQYPKNEVGDEVDVLHADKHESFLQVRHFIKKPFNKNINKNLHV